MEVFCPNCKANVQLFERHVITRQPKVLCPFCRQTIMIQQHARQQVNPASKYQPQPKQ